jgi:nucleotide-binding universal stress UspA family protein
MSGKLRDVGEVVRDREGGAVPDPQPTHRIVVGVDGSSCSLDALEWAIRQAQLTGARVLVVTAWQRPSAVGWGLPVAPSPSPSEDANSVLEEVLEPVRKRHPNVDIQSKTVEGHPAPALVEASQGADLVVVGSHGRGAFAGMLLGSVSRHCVSHASCPVLVVRRVETGIP